jgi:hypothetical protein
MNALISASANILRGRFMPWPMTTYCNSHAFTWPLSVFSEQPSRAAASAMVRSPSGGAILGLRVRRRSEVVVVTTGG